MTAYTELKGTKKKIIDVALDLFSANGYDSVSVDQIAKAVGIKAPSLYKHYKGKKEIFDTVVAMMEDELANQTLTMDAEAIVKFAIHDEHNSKFRKLLNLQQYKNHDLAEIYTKYYIDLYQDHFAREFQEQMNRGELVGGDAWIMALQFVSPILTTIEILDRQPEIEEGMMDVVRRHIAQFYQVYRNR